VSGGGGGGVVGGGGEGGADPHGGTAGGARKRGRPRKPPTPYSCAFSGCQKQITKRRFCAAHQKRRERARKKAQQQQQTVQIGHNEVSGVSEEQQVLLANLPPLPPMLQDATVATSQSLMLPFQLQLMAELNKQQTHAQYEHQSYDGSQQHHVTPASYATQASYAIAHQQSYSQQSRMEETFAPAYPIRTSTGKRKPEYSEAIDSSTETMTEPSNNCLEQIDGRLALNHSSVAAEGTNGEQQDANSAQVLAESHDDDDDDWNTRAIEGQEGSADHAQASPQFGIEVMGGGGVDNRTALTPQTSDGTKQHVQSSEELNESEGQEAAWS